MALTRQWGSCFCCGHWREMLLKIPKLRLLGERLFEGALQHPGLRLRSPAARERSVAGGADASLSERARCAPADSTCARNGPSTRSPVQRRRLFRDRRPQQPHMAMPSSSATGTSPCSPCEEVPPGFGSAAASSGHRYVAAPSLDASGLALDLRDQQAATAATSGSSSIRLVQGDPSSTRRLISSQRDKTASGEVTSVASPNTCGWRWTSLSWALVSARRLGQPEQIPDLPRSRGGRGGKGSTCTKQVAELFLRQRDGRPRRGSGRFTELFDRLDHLVALLERRWRTSD